MKFDNGYILIVDTDADRIAAAVRGGGDALAVPTLIARSSDDALQILKQCGAPALLMTSLALPGRDGLSVIESLRRIDDTAAVIAWTPDREIREYAVSQLSHTRAKVLGRALSADVCRRCVEALLARKETSTTPTAADVEAHEAHEAHEDRENREENWLDLAERARQQLQVAGAAAYTKVRDETEYRWSVSWKPDTPMPNFPIMLPSALEEVMASGAARVWTDLDNESRRSVPGAPSHVELRSLAIVPILRDGEVAGALCVFDSEPNALRDDHLETLSALTRRSPARRPGPALPVERTAADAIIKRELARVSGDQLQLSVIVFAITARTAHDLSAVGDMFASVVRGNDTVVRWTSAEVLVVLVGVERHVAELVAERIRGAVETRTANSIALSGAVTDLRATDSFEDAVARTARRLHKTARDGRPRIA
jgi:CheY-like chemotaxis protein